MRVPLFLSESQVRYETIFHPPAFSAQKRAKYMGVSGRLVAKCVLLAGPKGFVLAILPATSRVDTTALALVLNGPVRLARPEEVAHVFHDCEWGAIPPFGALYGLPTILDDGLAPDTMLIFEGHTHAQAIRMSCRDFEMLEHPRRSRFARP